MATLATRANSGWTEIFLAAGWANSRRARIFPTDAFFVAKQIAKVAEEGAYDLILMGRESIDFNGGQVHSMVGELMGLPSVSPVMVLDVEGSTAKIQREIEGGKEFMELDLPFVAGCQEPIAEWKIPNMRGIMSARTKPLNVVEPTGDEAPVKVEVFEMPPAKGDVKLIDPDNLGELVNLLKNEAKVL